MKKNSQLKKWVSKFGKEYTLRNNSQKLSDFDNLYKKQFGFTRSFINKKYIKYFKRNSRILEVGCNVGFQLDLLKKEKFKYLSGIEIQKNAIRIGNKKSPYIKFYNYSSDDLSFFSDESFDVICTTNFLIHLSKKNLMKTINEMSRLTSKYIWCMEYYSVNRKEIIYRGNKNLLWKDNFKKLFLKKNFEVVKSEKIIYTNPKEFGNVDEVFLLRKKKNDCIRTSKTRVKKN